MTKAVQRPKDELDRLLERLTVPAGFPEFILRDALRDVLRYIPRTASLELLNKCMGEFLKNVELTSFKSPAEMEADTLSKLLDEFQARKDESFTVVLPVHAGSEKQSEAKAAALASKVRKLLPATAWVFVGPSADGYPSVCISQGEKLSEVIGVQGEQGDCLFLIQDDGSERLEPLIGGESWEECVKRVNPENDEPLRLCTRIRTAQEAKEFESLEAASGSASERLLIGTHRGDEPQMPVKVGPKVGRNDPCPCGSGKKWKKCCMEPK
jgi:hypothetical protein